MTEKENKEGMIEFLEECDVKWDDLTEREKELASFIYKKLIKGIRMQLDYKIEPKLESLDVRTPNLVVRIANLGKFIAGDSLAVVDVWGEGCYPCLLIEPTMEKLAMEYKDTSTVKFGRIRWDKKISKKYDIDAVPTLLFFDGGEVKFRLVGAHEEKAIKDKIEERIRVKYIGK